MSVYFKGQTYPDLIVETGLDLSSATTLQVLYKKPGGSVTGVWDGVLEGSTQIRVSGIEFDKVGNWEIQAYAQFTDRQSFGTIETLPVGQPIRDQLNC